MNIRKRYLFFFTSFVGVVILAVAGGSIYVLHDTLSRVLDAENQAYVAVMGQRMMLKAVIGYGVLVLAIIAVSVPVGLMLSRLVSGAYLGIFENLNRIARERLRLDRQLAMDDNERTVLQKYIDLLVADQEKLRDYEKIRAWKEGARLLMHELRNPLTPLKLSAESLAMRRSDPEAMQDDVRGILNATRDVENILAVFREMVNLEFGPRQPCPARPLLDETFSQLRAAHGGFPVQERWDSTDALVMTEPALLKMVISNLVNNGMEANGKQFFVRLDESADALTADFVTPQREIAQPARIFRLRYSEKGPGRGYGLFLSRQISDYLDLDLKLENREEGVVFSIAMKKVSGGGMPA